MRSAIAFAIILGALGMGSLVYASPAQGTIDSVEKYAWGEGIGWLNFGTPGGNVTVTDQNLTGYIWSEQYGWINLAPQGSGVTNDARGNLSGSAWGENLGYLDFSGVTIDASGRFSGVASGTVAGHVSFNCAACAVTTDWRPQAIRNGGQGGGGQGGGGGTAPPLQVIINGGSVRTEQSNVTLTFAVPSDITHVVLSNFPDFHDALTLPLKQTIAWDLCRNITSCNPGAYAVYARFVSGSGPTYGPFAAGIGYRIDLPTPPKPSVIERIVDAIGSIIPDFLKPKPTPAPEIPVPLPTTPIAPLALKERWTLVPARAVNQFVFAPLPETIALFVEQFPDLQKVFKEVGIRRQADLPKLRGVNLRVAGLTSSALTRAFEKVRLETPQAIPQFQKVVLNIPGFSEKTLPGATLAGGRLASLPAVPLASLPASVKSEVPTGIVFARGAGEKVDLGLGVKLSAAGEIESQVRAIAGSLMQLTVKPEHPAKRVVGYLTFESKKVRPLTDAESALPTQVLLGALDFNAPSAKALPASGLRSMVEGSAKSLAAIASVTANTKQVEERYAVREFEYTDPDKDGIYTATIQAPVVDGEYSVYTIVQYADPTITQKEIKLVALIDPEGYIYESRNGRETRIPGAVATITYLNPDTKQYERWPAEQFNQENPQVTDVRGTYAFLVPPGFYAITVEAPGYETYTSAPFQVELGGSGVHMNIEMKAPYSFLADLDWKTMLLVIVVLFLLYNFYRDERRERMAAH